MNERAERRRQYLEGYCAEFRDWWSGGLYHGQQRVDRIYLEVAMFMTYEPPAKVDGRVAAKFWIYKNLPPMEGPHLTSPMLWPRPQEALEICEAMLRDLEKG